MLSIADLRIAFAGPEADSPAQEVVHGVSLDVMPGRVLGLVGESGSGKSVTAMSVLGLLPRSARVSGSIRLAGDELVGAPVERLRRARGGQVGTIFQEPMSALNPVFRIGDQIAEAIREHHPQTGRQAALRRVIELLGMVEVADPARIAASYPHELSGGQLQRAMIAMAISNDPLALIADEPTTALDVTVQAQILALIRDLKDRLGTAVLLITHDMGVVADVADDVSVMKDGEIVESAPAEVLYRRPQAEYTRRLLAAVPRLESLVISEDGSDDGRRPAADNPRAPDPDAPAAEITRLDIRYHGRGLGAGLLACHDVTLTIGRGETVGLVGESGSGKSTVGRALAGLISPAAGTVRIDGIDISRLRGRALRQLRTRIGMVFQDPASSLNPRHTVGRSIGEPLRLHSDLDPAARRREVARLLDAVQLGSVLAARYPHELSGGQRQRVAIARALSMRPSLLIADEPTSALDVSVQDQILNLIRDLRAELGFACLFISHDLAVVGELTSRVAVMRRGEIVETGPSRAVLHHPRDAYTQRLLAAVPVPDPQQQSERRRQWLELQQAPVA
ncbi:dipeptide ABC transporter ATP-binding protein [Microlunatus sp. Gsoil 973]|nr:dipeptide ABC transporter ATP-binding protein [Microlunatus sp. Gsoil 973]